MIPSRSDKRAWEIYRHSMEMANINGKPLEVTFREVDGWNLRSGNGYLDWRKYDYRLAPEPPSVTPWTFETAPSVLKVRSKKDGELFLAVCYPGYVNMGQGVGLREIFYSDLAEQFEQLSGEPCGVKAEAEWPKWFRNQLGNLYRMDSNKEGQFYELDYGSISKANWEAKELAAGEEGCKQITAAEAEALLKGVK